jgi:hypothetical protein
MHVSTLSSFKTRQTRQSDYSSFWAWVGNKFPVSVPVTEWIEDKVSHRVGLKKSAWLFGGRGEGGVIELEGKKSVNQANWSNSANLQFYMTMSPVMLAKSESGIKTNRRPYRELMKAEWFHSAVYFLACMAIQGQGVPNVQPLFKNLLMCWYIFGR